MPHVFHTMKKGSSLNLLRRPATTGQAERLVAMLADNLVTITNSQRSPRPLARYLAGKLEGRTGHRPRIDYRAGRHTALYRSTLLPEFDKESAKEEGDLRNHAVDAVVLGCDLPSASALENKRWSLGIGTIHGWLDQVRAAAPETLSGLPRVEAVPFVPFFERDLGGGYCAIDLSAFNWNRKRKATHVLDPFGMTRSGIPLKRRSASSVLAALTDPVRRDKQIASVANVGLRRVLGKEPEEAAIRLVRWLQGTVQAGLQQGGMGNHPADVARRGILDRFVKADPTRVVAGEEAIPSTVGVRCLVTGSQNKLDVVRVDRDGHEFQRYQADPVVHENCGWGIAWEKGTGSVAARSLHRQPGLRGPPIIRREEGAAGGPFRQPVAWSSPGLPGAVKGLPGTVAGDVHEVCGGRGDRRHLYHRSGLRHREDGWHAVPVPELRPGGRVDEAGGVSGDPAGVPVASLHCVRRQSR